MWSVRKVLAWRCIAPGVARRSSSQKGTHPRAWLAHSACKFLGCSLGKWFMKAWMTDGMSWDKVRRAQMRWSVQCEVWGVKSAVWSVECEVWSVKKDNEKWEVWSVKCGVWRVQCGVWRAQWEVRRGEVELQMWRVKQDAIFAECTHARAWLAHGACKFYRWERSYIYIYIYIFKATSAPRRAGTTGIISVSSELIFHYSRRIAGMFDHQGQRQEDPNVMSLAVVLSPPGSTKVEPLWLYEPSRLAFQDDHEHQMFFQGMVACSNRVGEWFETDFRNLNESCRLGCTQHCTCNILFRHQENHEPWNESFSNNHGDQSLAAELL